MISRFTKAFLFIVLGLVRLSLLIFPSCHKFLPMCISVHSFQLLFSSLTVLHPPSRAYFDPATGYLFGEGGVEQSLPRVQNPLPGSNADSQRDWVNIGHPPEHAKPVLDSNIPPVHESDNTVAGVAVTVDEGSVHGGVIMGKLGNATAKYVHLSGYCIHKFDAMLIMRYIELHWVVRLGNSCTFLLSCSIRHS